jgi:hypothetical protein
MAEARANLAVLHREFCPQYVVSSSWSNYLTREQMQQVFRLTGLEFVAVNLHKQWTTPKEIGATRLTEITKWITTHQQQAQLVLVLDDLESGWSLRGSPLEDKGYVVLCETWIGFVAEKLVEAQQQLWAQGARRTPEDAASTPVSDEQLHFADVDLEGEAQTQLASSEAAKIKTK